MTKRGIGRLIAIAASAALAAGAFFAQRTANEREQPVTADAFFLDTYCSMTLYNGGRDVLSAALSELKRYDTLFDPQNTDSDIYRINHRSEDSVIIDPETADMLSMAKELQEISGGALWPGIRPLTELWDLNNRKSVPSPSEIGDALSRSKAAEWEIVNSGTDEWVFRAKSTDTMIETGAFAKGYIADRLKELLTQNGVSSAVIDLGGNIHTIGVNTDGAPFRIGIRDPSGKETCRFVVEALGESVVTAGNYERYFTENGVRYHHILDPDTGWPVNNGLASVTVKGTSSFVCDALATACFVLGEEEGTELVHRFNKEKGTGYEVYFISDDQN